MYYLYLCAFKIFREIVEQIFILITVKYVFLSAFCKQNGLYSLIPVFHLLSGNT